MSYIHPYEKKAMEFFGKATAHKMYDEFPYFKHLQDTANNVHFYLSKINYDVIDGYDLVIASWGHDSMEDAGLSYSDIKKEFNENVADIIHCVTDNNNGKNRKEKKLLTYPKTRSNPDAIVIKLADRIANTEHSISQGKEKDSEFLKMYRKEYKQFRWNLFVPGHAVCLWERLDILMEWKGW